MHQSNLTRCTFSNLVRALLCVAVLIVLGLAFSHSVQNNSKKFDEETLRLAFQTRSKRLQQGSHEDIIAERMRLLAERPPAAAGKDRSSDEHHHRDGGRDVVHLGVKPQPVPSGNPPKSEDFPYWGEDFLDLATQTFEAIDPQTPSPSADPYDRPEDADDLAKVGSVWHELITKYRHASQEALYAPDSAAMCLIAVVYTRNCKYLDESLLECAKRVGFGNLERYLPEKCRWGNAYWSNLRSTHGAHSEKGTDVEAILKLQHGPVPAAEMCPEKEPTPYIPPSERTIPPFGNPRVCSNGAFQYPIGFHTPRRNMVPKLLPKLFDFPPIPLDSGKRRLGLNDEDTYQAIMALSHFCITHSRGGWDCGRHYDIFAAGCVPYFYDVMASGPYILPQLPKKFMMDVLKKPFLSHLGRATGAKGDHYFLSDEVFTYANRSQFNWRTRFRFINESFKINGSVPFDKAWYWSSARRVLKYAHAYLSTESMASYVLQRMGAENATHVAIVSRSAWDNLHQAFLTGLDGLGIRTTIFQTVKDEPLSFCVRHRIGAAPSNQQMAAERSKTHRGGVHGYGHPWANRMRMGKGHTFVNNLDHVGDGALRGQFDAAIYTYFNHGSYPLGLFSTLKEMTSGKVAIMDHDDSMDDPRRYGRSIAKEAFFFSRELRLAHC